MFVYFYQITMCHILEDSRLLKYQQFVLYSAGGGNFKFHKTKKFEVHVHNVYHTKFFSKLRMTEDTFNTLGLLETVFIIQQ